MLTGHYVQFVGEVAEGPNNYMSLNVFDFFASENHIQDLGTSLELQPAFHPSYPNSGAFASQMKKKNPRWPAGYADMNTVQNPYNCDAYNKLTSDGYFVFKLKEAVNVEYVQFIFESDTTNNQGLQGYSGRPTFANSCPADSIAAPPPR